MTDTARASLIVAGTGTLWGLYWLPVRALDAERLPGAWGTVLMTALAAALLAPFAWRARHELRAASLAALASIAIGGAAFAIYSVGLLYGRVALVILLYFLTPVWSTLLGRALFGWPITPARTAALLSGLLGLGLMLGADGGWPLPRSTGEWMALGAGMLWSVGTTGMRTRSTLGPAPAAFVFALGACLSALALAPLLSGGPPMPSPAALATALGAGALWWGLSIAALMWATIRLEPARAGILLMSEVVVGALSAALLASETLSPFELAGGALVLLAGILELRPAQTGR